QLDVPVISLLEQKFEKSRFTRVDSDIIDRLIIKEDAPKNELDAEASDKLSQTFRSQLPKLEKAEFYVEVQSLGEQAQPVVITQSEYMRRMKDISRFQPGMAFYGQMPDSYSFVLNSDHPLIKKVMEQQDQTIGESLQPILNEIKGQEARMAALRQMQDKKKPEEITQEEKDEVSNTQKAINEQQEKKNQVIADAAKDNKVVHQLIDLALLQNGMLKGAALDQFVKRSIELI
ncbi:MAG: molecular chaperone HtpG, partial [Prevotella sp.]|nr:molecular chaperone HtpG [Prevotella sp.]